MDKNNLKEKNMIEFYQKCVALFQKNTLEINECFETITLSMLWGREMKLDDFCMPAMYEMLLLTHLSSLTSSTNVPYFFETLKPFLLLGDASSYYTNLLIGKIIPLSYPLIIYDLYFLLEEYDESKEDRETLLYLMQKWDTPFLESRLALSKLKKIWREGWVRRNVKEDYLENDAAHTVQMLVLASAYIRTFQIEDLDVSKVFDMIILHEVGEISAGDITELDPSHASKHEIEKKAVYDTFSPLRTSPYFISLWEEFEQRETEEAKFVYQLDKMDPILKAMYLDPTLNRKDLTPDFFFFEEKRGTFAKGKLKSLFEEIKRQKWNR